MKKLTTVLLILGFSFIVFAGPPPKDRGRGGRHRPSPPPARHYHHYHHYHHDHGHGGSSGVRLAADIVGLVGNSIGVINALTPPTTVVVPAQPTVVQPAVTQPVVQPAVVQPVIQQPAVQQAPAVNQTVIIQQPPVPKTEGRENGYNPHGYNL